MEEIKYTLFNEHGSDEAVHTSIIEGNLTGLNDFNEVKYGWAIKLWNAMLGNTWFVEKITSFGKDSIDYQSSSTEDERFAYKAILSYLVFLDSVNSHNPAMFVS